MASLKIRSKQIKADSNEFAPSLEEANVILAKFGFVERRELAAA